MCRISRNLDTPTAQSPRTPDQSGEASHEQRTQPPRPQRRHITTHDSHHVILADQLSAPPTQLDTRWNSKLCVTRAILLATLPEKNHPLPLRAWQW